MEGVRRRKRDMVDRLIATHLTNYEKSGAELIIGEGHLSGAHTLEIKSRDGGTRRFTAERIFTDPELARVGLNERERQLGIAHRVVKMPAKPVLRTLTLSETRGFLKMLIEDQGNKILGFTAFATGA